MLERATACLNAGVRQPESLRCVRQALRTRHALHPAFWGSGSPSLDISSSPSVSQPLHNAASSEVNEGDHHRPKRHARSTLTCSTPESGPLLDFLYPPQALAYFQRVHAQAVSYSHSIGVREKRNVKQSARGQVRPTRGYSSKPELPSNDNDSGSAETSADSQAVTIDPFANDPFASDPFGKEDSRITSDQGEEQGLKEGQSLGVSGDAAPTIAFRALDETLSDYAKQLQEKRNSRRNMLLQESHKGLEDDPDRRLRSFLFRKPDLQDLDDHDRDATVDAVVQLYRSLPEKTQGDFVLRNELLYWLGDLATTSADTAFLSIWDAIPARIRPNGVYDTAIAVYLRQERALTQLHIDALEHLKDPSRIVYASIFAAIIEQKWDVAYEIWAKTLSRASPDQAQVVFDRLSARCADTKKLYKKGSGVVAWALEDELVKSTSSPAGEHKQLYQGPITKHAFAAFICRQAMDNCLPEGADLIRHKQPKEIEAIRLMAEFLARHESAASTIPYLLNYMDRLLRRMLRKGTAANQLLGHVYAAFRTIEGGIPSEDLLFSLLEVSLHHERHLSRSEDHQLPLSMIINDWERHYDRLSARAVRELGAFYAARGDIEKVEEYVDYLRHEYPEFSDWRRILWTRIRVRAVRREVTAAIAAFDEVNDLLRGFGKKPSPECWHSLLYAYYRADDLNGGLEVLEKMISAVGGLGAGRKPFHMISMMLARRGDVDGVKDILDQYDAIVQEPRSTAMAGPLILALINNEDFAEAENILRESMSKSRHSKSTGQHTQNFNLLLSGYASARNLDAANAVYKYMRREGIPLTRLTYAALMNVLVAHRKTDAALKILKTQMTQDGLLPTAYHFEILMHGFMNQGMTNSVIWVYALMGDMNVKSSRTCELLYLQASATMERRKNLKHRGGNDQGLSLQAGQVEAEFPKTTLEGLRDLLPGGEISVIDESEPNMPHDFKEHGRIAASYFAHVARVQGTARCLAAVEEFLDEYRIRGTDPPLGVITSLMKTFRHAKQYDDVEACWFLAKDQADRLSQLAPVPALVPDADPQIQPDTETTQPATEPISEEAQPTNEGSHTEVQTGAAVQDPPPARTVPAPPKKARTRTDILSGPLAQYSYALVAQKRLGRLIELITIVLQEGYTFDNVTWNKFIEHLCLQTPPLVLLAFALTERYLIANFPGWVQGQRTPRSAERITRFEHIKTRHHSKGHLMPFYRTMVEMGSSYLLLRNLENSGRVFELQQKSPEFVKYIGTTKQIREQAPRTLYFVQSIPVVNDKWQRQLLRRELE